MQALRIQNLKKSFGGLPAINDVSLEVAEGERRLIIGPNGAGKTTLFNLLTGDLPADGGSIAFFDRNVVRLRTHHRVHLGMARTYQIITLFPKDTLEHNVALSLLGLSRERWRMFGRVSPSFFEQARNVLARVGLEGAAARPVAEVAYGEKRRVEIAMALAQKPRVLLLDEPLAGLSREELPMTECLKDTVARVVPYWKERIAPRVQRGERILVAAHGNSIRALIKYFDNMSDEAIIQENVPTGMPLVYEFDDALRPGGRQYLGDPEAVAKAMSSVASQGKVR